MSADSMQPDLWTSAPPKRKRHRTADTSSDAFERVKPVRGHQQQIVLDALRGYGPMTRHQIAAVTGMPLSSVCGRVNELLKRHEVETLVREGRKQRRDGSYVVTAVIHHTLARAG